MSPIATRFLQYLEHSQLHEYSFSLILLLFMLFLFSTTLIISFKSSNSPTKTLNLPPSPSNKLPIVGHLHQLGPLPHHPLQALAQKHGPDLMMIHLGLSPTLVVSSPQAAKEIMKTHDLIFSNRPNLNINQRLFYDKDLAFIPYGEYWRQMRKICILQIFSAKRVQSFRSVREEETQVMIQMINDSSSCNSSQVVNLGEILVTFTNNIICRVAFGRKYSSEQVRKRFGEILEENIHLLGVFNIEDFIPWVGWVINHFNGLNARVEKNFRETDSFLERVIEEHMVKRKREGKDGDSKGDEDHHQECYKEDLVDVLLGINVDKENSSGLVGGSLGRDNIKGIILDMFVAGTDTSKSVIVWAMTELMRHPTAMRQVQQEVREIVKGRQNVTEDDLNKMHYLQCIIKETLRLHPPLPLLIPRESTEDVKIHGYDIPAKTRVFINSYAIGRDPESWKEPNKFEPERFMNSSVDFKGHDFEFIPFGAGRRGCPGIAFATATVELGLANLLFRFDWKWPADHAINDEAAPGDQQGDIDMGETPGLVVHKKSPLLLVATDHFLLYN